ncbi:MAG: T9SS type A sorting domain-containing protein [Chitinophagaceae bacterium]|nr:T9SS type A sorting domain-containing protein [Chitinophagaceae bacterium]
MKNLLLFFALLCCFCATKTNVLAQPSTAYFIENKGQIKDTKGNILQNIDYIFRGKDITVLVGAGRLEYVITKGRNAEKIIMQLSHTQKAKLIAESKTSYHENYYLDDNAVITANAAERICYQNIYPNIDWVLYLHEGKLEHEFVCHKGANYAAIQWTYDRAKQEKLDAEGNLIVYGSFGELKENKPQCFDKNGKDITTTYQNINNTWAYQSTSQRPVMTIDPSVEWSTYQNSSTSTQTYINGSCNDKVRSIYVCGTTNAQTGFASSSGVYQSSSIGEASAFISKFDTLGNHIWTTFYAGEKRSFAYAIDYYKGHLYIAGMATSATGIATAGTAQSSLAVGTDADNDAFVAKLDTNGLRVWGTYCGGNRSEEFRDIKVNKWGDIYATGLTLSRVGIATAGAFKTVFPSGLDTNLADVMLVKYDQNGQKIWGTYVGGNKYESGETIYLHENKVYISGRTYSNNGIATLGSHQPNYYSVADPNKNDLYLMQFDSSGNRNWGTYYGGNSYENMPILVTNKRGDIYLYGLTSSTDSIATPGAYQTTFGGGFGDCFLAKFDSLGKRYWGTYIGGNNEELSKALYGGNIAVDDASGDDNNVYLSGITKSIGLATAGAFKDTITNPAKREIFVASFSGKGVPFYFSYFGGEDDDEVSSTVYLNKSIYIAGRTKSSTGIATTGAYKTTHASFDFSGFLTKIGSANPTAIKQIPVKEIAALRIFPNPAQMQLNISAQFASTENGNIELSLYNVVGKKVQTENASIINGKLEHQMRFFETLQAGIYYLQAQYKDWETTEKIAKE